MNPKFVVAECNPLLDPYHRDTCSASRTMFWVDLETGEYGINQEFDDNSTPEPEWHGRIQTETLIGWPNESQAKAYLQSEECIALIQTILDNSIIEWNGSNRVGWIEGDGLDAWQDIMDDLDAMDANAKQIWTCEDVIPADDLLNYLLQLRDSLKETWHE
jgi:hypothetical protein